MFWSSARGATIIDSEGTRYTDLTSAFGVANVGHSNPRVATAVAAQAHRLIHGMGDVHPAEIRVALYERLAGIVPAELARFFLATTGSEAVEAALKTAMLATGKSRFAAFEGAYHGLSFGALAVGGMPHFRVPFSAALGPAPLLLPYPRTGATTAREAGARTRRVLGARHDVAAVVIEPVQGRAGCIVPPPGYLAELRAACDDLGIVMIADEIFTGFGRTGSWFGVDREGVVPDILCVGKAMGSGVPISAIAGRTSVMDAWPPSQGEALHTSTYLGNPLGCAAAIATIDEMRRAALPARASQLGNQVAQRLSELRLIRGVCDVRGVGLAWGVQLRDAATAGAVVRACLARGVIVLQSGVAGDTIAMMPPLIIGRRALDRALDVVTSEIAHRSAGSDAARAAATPSRTQPL